MSGAAAAVGEKPYPIEKLPPGWITAEVTLRRRNGTAERRNEIIELKTNDRYWHEPLDGIISKCVVLAISGVFLYSLGYMAWNAIRIPTTAVGSLASGVEQAIAAPRWSAKCTCILQGISNSVKAVVSGIWTIVRAPFYLLGMFFASLLGIVRPLQGRVLFASAEVGLHQKTRKQDFVRHRPEGMTDYAIAYHSLLEKDFPGTFFAAYCMQPWGKTTDPHIVSVQQLSPEAGA